MLRIMIIADVTRMVHVIELILKETIHFMLVDTETVIIYQIVLNFNPPSALVVVTVGVTVSSELTSSSRQQRCVTSA